MLKNNEKTTSSEDPTEVETLAVEIEAEDGVEASYELHISAASVPFSSYFAVSADFFGYAMDRLSNVSPVELAEIQTRIRADAAANQDNDLLVENLENKASEGGESVADTRRFGYTINSGIAVVPLTGLMTKRPSCMSWLMGEGSSTLRVMQALRHADANPDVNSKLLVIDSPGGEVSGSFDLADMVRNGKKPTDAHIEDLGASAAYLVASGARHISANQNAAVGSIGVYTKMVDSTDAYTQRGQKVHLVKAGAHKAIGESGVPVTKEHIAHVQSRIDSIHSLFLRNVTKGRENITKPQLAEVADAGVFIGKQALKIGLVDKISDTPSALRHAMQLNKDNVKSKGNDRMVKDEELRAMLAGTTTAVAAVAETPAPAAMETVATDAPANPLLATLTSMGVKDVADLRGLAADALDGRSYLAEQRTLAIKLGNVVINAQEPGNTTLVDNLAAYINSAPLNVVAASISNSRVSMKAQGLTEDKTRQTAPAKSAFAAQIEDSESGKPHAATSHVAKAYGTHPILGGTK